MSQKFTLVLSRQREQYWVWQRRQGGGRQRQAGRPRQEPGGGFDEDDVWWSSYHDHWNCHLCVSVGIWPVSNQLVGHRVEQLWVHRLKKSLKFKWFDLTLLSWSIPSGSPRSLLSTISSGTLGSCLSYLSTVFTKVNECCSMRWRHGSGPSGSSSSSPARSLRTLRQHWLPSPWNICWRT